MAALWEPDSATLALLSVCVVLAAVTYQLLPPPPLAHPVLLGRQALVQSPARLTGQSAVYTTAQNGGARPPYRPDAKLRTLADILAGSTAALEGNKNSLGSAAHGHTLAETVRFVRAALVRRIRSAGDRPEHGTVLVALDDPADSLLVTLALATSPYSPCVLAPGTDAAAAADLAPTPSDLVVAVVRSLTWILPHADILQVVIDTDEGEGDAAELIESGKVLVADGKDGARANAPGEPADVVVTLCSDGERLQLTNQNLTASLVTWGSLFPTSPQPTRPTMRDSVLSFHHPATPYGFGLALYLISVSAGVSFPTLDRGSETDPDTFAALIKDPLRPAPTFIFGAADVVAKPVYSLILSEMLGDSSFIIRAARDGKLRLLREGIVTKQSFWDAIVYKGLRKDTNLTRLRALILSAPPAFDQSRIETLRGALGCPVLQTLAHPALLAPICAGLMFDVQRLPPPGARRLRGNERQHVGPPALGMEVKFVGQEEEIAAGRVRGEVLVRTPVLPNPNTLSRHLLSTDSSLPALPPYPDSIRGASAASAKDPVQWFKTGIVAEISPEGTVWVDETASRALV